MKNPEALEDTFLTQAPEGDISSSPWRLRGAVWQKPGPETSLQKDGRLTDQQLSRALSTQQQSLKTCPEEETNGCLLLTTQSAPLHPASISALNKPKNKPSIDARVSPRDRQSVNSRMEFDAAKELADLPSDAFASSSSSSPERTLPQQTIILSSQASLPSEKRQRLAAPANGLQQMTLFGATAQKDGPAVQAAKRYNYALVSREEPPTHHRLNQEALKTYIYPTNLGKIRDYQFSIVKRGLFHNVLVALPTGLGKTFIAATIMLNWFRWTVDAQIVFVAPTKPLVSQQVEACFGIAGIPRSQTSMLTGTTPPGLRAQEWNTKRVFFMTPQTLDNDLKTGIADPKRIVLLVVDEAHRATGNYAYVGVVSFLRRFNQSFRVLALTATPGASVEAVQEVINGLKISRVEIRTEFSIDIREYIHSKQTETFCFDNSEEMEFVMELFSKALNPLLQKLRAQQGYWTADPMQLTAYGLNQGRQRWMQTAGKNASMGIKGMVNRLFAVLASLAHSIELLKYHGIGPFYHNMVIFRNSVSGPKSGKYEKEVAESDSFQKMMTRIGFWIRDDRFIGHPKLEHLQQIVLNHFLDAGVGRPAANGQPPSATRVMIFAHYRDSAEEIVRVLKRNEPMLRPHVFVGQAASKGSEGMDQKRQLEVIHDFKNGKYNTLVATSIGEEGLDIGEIDLIICYDSSASPIRMLQRMGRTGRKRAGRIVLLLMNGKEANSINAAKDNYEKMQKIIAEGTKFDFHEDSARRILPKGMDPVADRCVVDIPAENSQAGLPEPRKRGRAPKRPPKKFNMPDGVRTGFVTASRMQRGEDSEEEGTSSPTRQIHRLSKPSEILAPVLALSDVLLTKEQEAELFQSYQDLPLAEDTVIQQPSLMEHPARQRVLAPTYRLRHGAATRSAVKTLQSMAKVNMHRITTLARVSQDLNMDKVCENNRIFAPRLDLPEDELPLRTQTVASKPDQPQRAGLTRTSARDASSKARDWQKPPIAESKGRKQQRGRQTTARKSRESSALEGSSSSVPPTPSGMALPTQGIDLGSDTSGEDEQEGEPSSDLRDFVVESDEDELRNTLTPSPSAPTERSQQGDLAAINQESSDEGTALTDDDEDLLSLNALVQTRITDPEFGVRKRKASSEQPEKGKRRIRRIIEDSSD